MAIFFPHNSFLAARATRDGLTALVRQWGRDADGRLFADWRAAVSRDGDGAERHLPVAGRS